MIYSTNQLIQEIIHASLYEETVTMYYYYKARNWSHPKVPNADVFHFKGLSFAIRISNLKPPNQ